MANKLLSLKEAAQESGKNYWDLVKLVLNEGLAHTSENGEFKYVRSDLGLEPKREPRRKIVRSPNGKKRLTPEEFTLEAIGRLKKPGKQGIHSTYSGFNKEFRERFPGMDPIKATQRMEEEGIVRLARSRGGVIILPIRIELNDDDLAAMDDSSYNYENKNEWRDRWFRFQGDYLGKGNDDSRSLCLGGFGGEIPGYQRLGIPLERIVAVEKDFEKAAYLRAKFPGLDVQEGELINFLAKTDLKFDRVMLDYDQSVTGHRVRELEMIVRRQLLKEKSVLGVNFFARREQEDAQMLLIEPYIEKKLGSIVAGEGFKDEIPSTVLDVSDNLNGVRDYGITGIVLKLLRGRETSEISRALLKVLPAKERRKWEERLEQEEMRSFIKYIETNSEIRESLGKELKKGRINAQLSLVMAAYHSRPYFVEGMERLVYQTEARNNEFYSDFFALDQRRERFKGVIEEQELREFIVSNKRISELVVDFGRLVDRKRRRMNWLIGNTGKNLKQGYKGLWISEDVIPQRERIGKGPRPQLPSRLRDAAISAMYCGGVAGKTERQIDKEIVEEFPALKNSLPGIKSAYKKGQYDDIIKEKFGGQR